MILFADSFDDRHFHWSGVRNDSQLGASWPVDGGRDGGPCVRFSLTGGRTQQSVFVEKTFNYNDSILYLSAWWRFPLGFSFTGAQGTDSTEHKLFAVFTSDGVGRVLVNLRGSGTSPVLQTHLERLDPYPPGVSQWSSTPWPPDGLWHRVEVELLRDPSVGRIRVWLDGRLVIDQSGRTCGPDRSPVTAVQVGAYSNQGSNVNQFFFVDDVTIGTEPRSVVVTPVPVPTPPPTFDPPPALEILLQLNLDLAERLDKASLLLQELLKK